MAFVVVGQRLTAALFQRKAWLGAVERLNLSLLVQRQHQRVLRRVEVKANHVLQLLGKARVVAELERLDQMWLEAVLSPDAAHGLFAYAARFGHGAGAPLRSLGRLLLSGLADDLLNRFRRQRRLTARAWGILLDAGDALLEKAKAPAGYGGRSRRQELRNLLVLASVRSQQHHSRSLAD